MDTLKTAVIVVLLLAVVYGAYVVLSKPDAPLPQEIAWHDQKSSEPLQIEMGKPEPQSLSGSTDKTTPKFDSMWSGDSKNSEPKSLNSESKLLDQAGAAASDKTSPDMPDVRKPSASGPGFAASPATLDKPIENQSLSEPAKPVAAPNLLGGAAADNPSTSESSKTASNAGLPSLPDLRSAPATEKALSTLADSLSLPKASDSVARLDPLGTTELTPVGTADQAAAKGADATQTASSTVPSAGAPDPSLGPIPDASSGSTGTSSVTTSAVYEAALREAQWQMDEGKWQSALFTLSKFLHSPDLTAEQQSQLYDLLDPLAAKVIYSQEHLVEAAYEVQRGDRLADIAQKFQVPWELLANINGVENPEVLIPGTKLKVVRGPFRADVDLQANELTLFAGQLYAGRFPVSVGKDPAPKPGEYRVMEKQPGRVYYAGDGRTIPAEDATNPYGRAWLGLGNELSIHSSPDGGEANGMGCISLSPLDATDVYSILSQGSSVVIRR